MRATNPALAAAMFYARASAVRAVSGIVPGQDRKADAANWRRTAASVRADCVAMVLGVLAAAEKGDG